LYLLRGGKQNAESGAGSQLTEKVGKLLTCHAFVACRLTSHNLTAQDAYASFVIRAQEIAMKHGFEPVNW
jgi:hypothetical protein